MGTHVWGNNAKDEVDPVRVEKAFPAIATKTQRGQETALDGSEELTRGALRKLSAWKAPLDRGPEALLSWTAFTGHVRCLSFKSSIATLAALVTLTATSCGDSPESEMVERVAEVERVVDVVKEVTVVATPPTVSTPVTTAAPPLVTEELIAFVSKRGVGGYSEIYVMNSDGSGVNRLTNESWGHWNPIWSPDRRRIAFVSDRGVGGYSEIYVMNSDGSGVNRLTDDVVLVESPSWSPGGRHIAFMSIVDGDSEIYVANADGSGINQLTNNKAGDEVPSWSPDGRCITFQSDRDGDWNIYVANMDGSHVTRLTHESGGHWNPIWSPDGRRIAFGSRRDGNREVYVMNVNGSDLTRLTENEATDKKPSWSPDGQRIAFESRRDGNYDIYVANVDGSGVTRLTDELAPQRLSWSPDGRRIAFESRRDGNYNIYVANVDGSGVTRLTDDSALDGYPSWSPAVGSGGAETTLIPDCNPAGNVTGLTEPIRLTDNEAPDYGPIWSPDGRRIAFVSSRDGNREVYVMNADGSDLARLTDNEASDLHPDWSPDGRSITYVSLFRKYSSERYHDLRMMNADGSDDEPLIARSDDVVGEPSWSPDGRHIAFQSNDSGENPEIAVMEVDRDSVKILTFLNKAEYPAWSPDGERILFTAIDNPPPSSRADQSDVFVINVDGSSQTNLTKDDGWDQAPNWSPDGQRIAFSSDRDGDAEIYVMSADGSSLTQLTDNSAGDWSPVWSPSDGRSIAFVSNRGGNEHIYLMDADGSNQTRLADISASVANLTWSPDGRQIAFDSRRDGNTDIYVINVDGSDVAVGADLRIEQRADEFRPIYLGEENDIIVEVRNVGDEQSGRFNLVLDFTSAVDGSTARLYGVGSGDLLVGREDEVGPGATATLGIAAEVPGDLVPGEYRVCARIEHPGAADVGPDGGTCLDRYVLRRFEGATSVMVSPIETDAGRRAWVAMPTDWGDEELLREAIDWMGLKDDDTLRGLYKRVAAELAFRRAVAPGPERRHVLLQGLTEDWRGPTGILQHITELCLDSGFECAGALDRFDLPGSGLLANLPDGAKDAVGFGGQSVSGGLLFGDAYFTMLVNQALDLDQALDTLDQLEGLPLGPIWVEAVAEARKDVVATASPDGWTAYAAAIVQNKDEFLQFALGQTVSGLTHAAAKKQLIYHLGIAGQKALAHALGLKVAGGTAAGTAGTAAAGPALFVASVWFASEVYLSVEEKKEELGTATLTAFINAAFSDPAQRGNLREAIAYAKYATYDNLFEAEEGWQQWISSALRLNLQGRSQYLEYMDVEREKALEELMYLLGPESIEVDPVVLTLAEGETKKLRAKATARSGRDAGHSGFEWSSDAPGTTTVSQDGVVTGVAAGKAVIFVRTEGAEASASVEVRAADP